MIEYAKEYLAHNISVWHPSTVQRSSYYQIAALCVQSTCTHIIVVYSAPLISTVGVLAVTSFRLLRTVVSFIRQLSFLNVASLPHKTSGTTSVLM